ncbi:MAG: DmsC/YnfH family molybdoenzyme membrane anchor subunit, partial [Sulfuriferula sp.]
NAWRAFSRYRTSWLSREGVFAVVFFPFAMAYLGLIWLDMAQLKWLESTVGVLAAIMAWVTIFSTGMIYGCLKTIRQWNSPLVPANYLALGHLLGALLLLVVANNGAVVVGPYVALSLGMLAAAATLKAIYYFWISQPGATSTINTATGFTRGTVRLLDAGHTHGTFLTEEFGFQIARQYALFLKAFVFLAGFVIPAVMLLSGGLLYVAVSLAVLGVVAERWLFFAEARHVVNLYHGAQRT